MWLDSDCGEDQHDQNGGDDEATEAALRRLTRGQISWARDKWPEYHESLAIGLLINGVNKEMDLAELRVGLAQWKANEGENPGSFDNLYSPKDESSLLMICSRSSILQGNVARLDMRIVGAWIPSL